MPQHTLTLQTFKRTAGGKIRLCGSVSTGDGQILVSARDEPTLRDLSRTLRKGGFVPTGLVITKKCSIKFRYSGNLPPTV